MSDGASPLRGARRFAAPVFCVAVVVLGASSEALSATPRRTRGRGGAPRHSTVASLRGTATSQPFLYDSAATLAERYAAYVAHCERCVADDGAFRTFKAAPEYADILEHVTEEQGAMYAHFLRSEYPGLLLDGRLSEAMRAATACGSPAVVSSYEGVAVDPVSPTQLRYLKVLGDLRALVGGSLAGRRVLEVGGGYGGQAQLALAAKGDHAPASWRVRDLPCAEDLAARAIGATLAPEDAARFAAGPAPPGDPAADVFVSNYALSELPRDVQAPYVALAETAAYGYVTWNHGIHADAINAAEFVDRIRTARPDAAVLVADECPPTAPQNVCVTWRPAAAASS